MAKPQILVAAPTYKGMKYCNEEFLNSLKQINYENYDILIMDNSRTDDFFNELKKIKEIIVIKDKTKEERNYHRIVSSRNKILDYAKENNYDYILMMDSDVIAPVSIIEDLLSCNKDIVSGVYCNYFPDGEGKFKWLPVCWVLFTGPEFQELKTKYNISENITREKMPRHLTDDEVKSSKLFRVVYPSAGCMLLSRKVFTNPNIKYGLAYKNGKRTTSDDIFFIREAKKQGFIPHCYTKVFCEHLVEGKLKKKGDKLFHPLFINQN